MRQNSVLMIGTWSASCWKQNLIKVYLSLPDSTLRLLSPLFYSLFMFPRVFSFICTLSIRLFDIPPSVVSLFSPLMDPLDAATSIDVFVPPLLPSKMGPASDTGPGNTHCMSPCVCVCRWFTEYESLADVFIRTDRNLFCEPAERITVNVIGCICFGHLHSKPAGGSIAHLQRWSFTNR